jgi:hypothetical protein
LFLNRFYLTNYFETNEFEWLKKTNPEIVILGSSTSKYSINPIYLSGLLNIDSLTVINAAITASNPIKSYFILETIIDKIDSNFLLFFGFDSWVFSEKYYRYEPILISNWSANQKYSYILKYGISSEPVLGGNFLASLNKILSKPINKIIPSNNGWESPKDMSLDINATPPLNEWFDYPVFKQSKLYFDYLRKIIKEISVRDGRFVLFIPPKRKDWIDEYNSMDEVKKIFDNELISLNCKIVDYSNIFYGYEQQAFFVDKVHLSYYGAQEFTRLISEEVLKLKKIPN